MPLSFWAQRRSAIVRAARRPRMALRRHRRLQELDDRPRRLPRLLPEEHVAHARYDPHLGAGYTLVKDIRVPHRHQLVAVAVDDKRRRLDLRQPFVSIELLDRHELTPDALPRRGGGHPGADDPCPELLPGPLYELRRRRRQQELADGVLLPPPRLSPLSPAPLSHPRRPRRQRERADGALLPPAGLCRVSRDLR